MLQEGIYLSGGDKTMPEDEFILKEVEVKEENPEQGKKYYAFEVRIIRSDGPYILYIDTALLEWEECAVSHSYAYADYWIEYDSWADRGKDGYGRCYYRLENYLAIIIDVNSQEITKEDYQIMLTGSPKEGVDVNT